MDITTKIGGGVGLLIAGGSLLHTDIEFVKENPLEVLAACTIITVAGVGVAKLAGYIADNTIGRYISRQKDKCRAKYENGKT